MATTDAPKRKYKPKKEKESTFNPVLKPIELELTDPKRILFASWYLNPESPTYGKARQSAIKAGFSATYAKNILHQAGNWLVEILDTFRKSDLIQLARENLKDDLTLETKEKVRDMFGTVLKDEDGSTLLKRNAKLMSIRQNATTLVLQSLDKDFEKKEKGMFEGMAGNVVFNFFTPDGKPMKQADTVPINTIQNHGTNN